MSTVPFPDESLPPGREDSLAAGTVAGFVVLYFLLGWISYVHPMRGTNITPWNPQAALAVALLAYSPRYWWLVLLTIVLAAVALDTPPLAPADIVAAAMQAMGYVCTGVALRRWLGRVPWIATRADYLRFLPIALAGAAFSSALYVGTLVAMGSPAGEHLVIAFLRAAIGDGVSLVVSLPVILALAVADKRAQALAMVRTLEWWLVALAALLAAYGVFAQPSPDQFKVFYLLFLPVAWGAARFGTIGAVWSAALVQALLIVAVQGAAYRPVAVFDLHMLMAALGATGLLLGATVDEREEAAQALRESLRAAAAADMAVALAHELNQPLTALRTYARAAQLLAQQPASGPDALQDVTGKLVAEANRAGEVVKRLRDFFRQRGTQLQRTDIAPLIDSVVRSQALRAQGSDVALESTCDASVPPVWMDPVQIEVVLRNLLANALDAAAMSAAGRRFVKVAASCSGPDLMVSVCDSGPGIAAEDLPHVFESRRSSKPGGMGVGLMISRSIVEAHEGRLWAEAGPGGRFFFTLPLSMADPVGDVRE